MNAKEATKNEIAAMSDTQLRAAFDAIDAKITTPRECPAEDRGDEFTDAWEALEARARGANVGDVLSFDEFAARIVEEAR